MAQCDPQALLENAACFECLTPGERELAKLALLAQLVLAANPTADVTPQGLLKNAACYNCVSPGMWKLMELQLLCEILNNGT